MYEVNGHWDMFHLGCNCLGLDDVDAVLTIFVNWQQTNVLFVEAKEFCHILKVEAFPSSCRGTTSFDVGGMKCNTFLLFGLPINDNIVDDSNDIVPSNDGDTKKYITCFGCQFRGHYRDKCPMSQGLVT